VTQKLCSTSFPQTTISVIIPYKTTGKPSLWNSQQLSKSSFLSIKATAAMTIYNFRAVRASLLEPMFHRFEIDTTADWKTVPHYCYWLHITMYTPQLADAWLTVAEVKSDWHDWKRSMQMQLRRPWGAWWSATIPADRSCRRPLYLQAQVHLCPSVLVLPPGQHGPVDFPHRRPVLQATTLSNHATRHFYWMTIVT